MDNAKRIVANERLTELCLDVADVEVLRPGAAHHEIFKDMSGVKVGLDRKPDQAREVIEAAKEYYGFASLDKVLEEVFLTYHGDETHAVECDGR